MRLAFLALSAALILMGLGASWIDFPIRKDVGSFAFPIWGSLSGSNHFEPGSFGLLITFLVIGSLLAFITSRSKVLLGCAAGLLLISILIPFQIAYGDPSWLRALADEHNQYQRIQGFSDDYLPSNRGEKPTLSLDLEFESPLDRLSSSWYFLGLGWYLFLSGSLILAALSMGRIQNRAEGRTIAFTSAFLVTLLLFLILARPLIAEHQLELALEAQANGQTDEALHHYNNVLRWDSWYQWGPEIPRKIGSLHTGLHFTDSAEYHLYRGYVLEMQGMDPSALFEYQQFSEISESTVGQRESTRLLISLGLERYAEGKKVSAIDAWERALQKDPKQIQAAFYLARAYYDLAQYQKAILMNQGVMKQVTDTHILTHVYANLGDCYQKVGAFFEARTHYNLSMEIDDVQNFRAVMSLAGR